MHGHRPVGTGDARHFAAVIVAVQHELAADAADHRLEGGGVGEALEAALGGERRMMDQHDPAQALAPEIGQQPLGLGDLRLAQGAGGEQGRLGHAARQADQRHRSAPAQGREDVEAGRRRLAVARDVGAPQAEALGPGRGDIDVVVAGNDGDVVRAAEPGQPFGGAAELGGQRDVHQVAGQRDVVGLLRP